MLSPAWLTDPSNANYVAPALRDPNAVKLLVALPAPNIAGTQQFVNSQATINNTRQEVVRVDYDFNANLRLTGRYTHDNSFTEEPGGLFREPDGRAERVDDRHERAGTGRRRAAAKHHRLASR